ncbi:S41 family peptidase [Chryseobacterium sp. OSA05B]|uniref:S41 family peptidase n=1 Tax=Chryseobacterium sp. OSA05B TaxID=2862650 RepID=UPI001CBCA80D|nr:S41 family peptidase [Chryseobacterium sp. OSA05B]
MISTAKTAFAYFMFFIFFSQLFSAQQPIVKLTPAEKKLVIDSICKRLKDIYIFPEKAKKMADGISYKYDRGDYNIIDDPSQFAGKLAADLVNISQDRHINITFDPIWVQTSRKAISKKDSLELLSRDFPNALADNFGFKTVDILAGNIGYLNLTRFYAPALGGDTATSVMNFLSNTESIIIDLRQNDGGRGDMVQLIASYFFESEPIMIADIYSREDDHHRQDWTLPYLPGKRMPDKPLYLLVGQATFSAAESLSYFLKNRNRAILVGQVTGGGAHPVHHKILTDRFTLFIPYARFIDPITNTDWEGTGVIPDIVVSEKEALTTAHIAALEGVVKDQAKSRSKTWALEVVKARIKPIAISPVILKSYTGSYAGGIRKLTYEEGKLYIQRNGEPRYELVPLSGKTFHIEELPYLHIKINTENGKAVSLIRQYNDGSDIQDPKD